MLQQDVIQPFSNKMKHNTDQSNHMPFTYVKVSKKYKGLILMFLQGGVETDGKSVWITFSV